MLQPDKRLDDLIADIETDLLSIKSWNEWMDDFTDNIYPHIFKDRGISLDTAILIYQSNEMKNKLSRIEEALNDDSPQGI